MISNIRRVGPIEIDGRYFKTMTAYRKWKNPKRNSPGGIALGCPSHSKPGEGGGCSAIGCRSANTMSFRPYDMLK